MKLLQKLDKSYLNLISCQGNNERSANLPDSRLARPNWYTISV